MHPVPASLVGARSDDATCAGAAHDDRFPGEGGIIEHLDRRKERVHVDVQKGGECGRSVTEGQPAEPFGVGDAGPPALLGRVRRTASPAQPS